MSQSQWWNHPFFCSYKILQIHQAEQDQLQVPTRSLLPNPCLGRVAQAKICSPRAKGFETPSLLFVFHHTKLVKLVTSQQAGDFYTISNAHCSNASMSSHILPMPHQPSLHKHRYRDIKSSPSLMSTRKLACAVSSLPFGTLCSEHHEEHWTTNREKTYTVSGPCACAAHKFWLARCEFRAMLALHFLDFGHGGRRASVMFDLINRPMWSITRVMSLNSYKYYTPLLHNLQMHPSFKVSLSIADQQLLPVIITLVGVEAEKKSVMGNVLQTE